MKQALGLVEISGLSTAVVVADTMVKAANIRILEIENTKGLGYMTIKVVGDVGAVTASVDAGCQLGRIHGKLVSRKVIARPSDYVESIFCKQEEPTPPVPPQPTESVKDVEVEVPVAEVEVSVAEVEVPAVEVEIPVVEVEVPVTSSVKKAARKAGSDKDKNNNIR